MSESERKPLLEELFPGTVFIGWASVIANGKVDLTKIEETPIYASVPIFLPEDQLERFKQYNEEKDEKEQQGSQSSR